MMDNQHAIRILNELIHFENLRGGMYQQSLLMGIKALDEQDEITHCKDCVYYNGKYCVVDYITGKSESTVTRDSDDFCSYGERKTKNVYL